MSGRPKTKSAKQEELQLPPLPTFTAKLIQDCKDRSDPMPIMFEWFKHTGILAALVAGIVPKQAGVHKLVSAHSGALRGLMNRCARLILSTLKLGHDRKCRETIAIMGRCISESAVTIRWLSSDTDGSRFLQFFAKALNSDRQFEKIIQKNIVARGGKTWSIELRILKSIEQARSATGFDEHKLKATRELPSFEELCRVVGYDETLYGEVFRMGSHSIHGDWVDLLSFYLKPDDSGEFTVTESAIPLPSQLMTPALLVLDAVEDFTTRLIKDDSTLRAIKIHIKTVRHGIIETNKLYPPGDFNVQ